LSTRCRSFNSCFPLLQWFALGWSTIFLSREISRNIYFVFREMIFFISRNFAKLKSLSSLFRILRNKKKSYFATTLVCPSSFPIILHSLLHFLFPTYLVTRYTGTL
jgi:hypothetical protein